MPVGVIYDNKSAYLTTFGSCAVPTFHSTFSMSDDDLPHTISLGMLWSSKHSPPTKHCTNTQHFNDCSCVRSLTKPVKHTSAHTSTQRARHILHQINMDFYQNHPQLTLALHYTLYLGEGGYYARLLSTANLLYFKTLIAFYTFIFCLSA